ncbi:MAG: DUF308 domain-containing protein [Alphaproteobacteria bacterium]|nr:DUF308 domain-containing protein [Alphaproteobacteria bacterium]
MVKQIKKQKSKFKYADENPVAYGVQRLYSRSVPLLLGEALLFIGIGVLMLIKPLDVLMLLTLVLGGGLILSGLYRVIAGFVASYGYGGAWVDVVFGLINIAIGVLFCVYPLGAVISLVYVFVVLFGVKAFRALVFAINMARVRFGNWRFNFIVAMLLVVVTIMLLFYPTAGAIAVVVYLAIMLFMYALFDLYMFWQLRRLKRVIAD